MNARVSVCARVPGPYAPASSSLGERASSPTHEVVETIARIPPAAFVASGLGAWRRAVLALTQEPGADVCKAYLRVASRVISTAEAIRDEQARAAGDAASGSAGA